DDILDSAITAQKIAERAVESVKIALAAITEELIAAGAITADKIAQQAVGVAKFAAGLRPIQIVDELPELPDADYPEGAVIFLTTDHKLYRSTGTEWTAEVPATDLTGQIVEGQIANEAITAVKIAEKAVTEAKLALG